MVSRNDEHQQLKQLIADLRQEANESDSDVVGNAEYRIKHETANRISECLK